MAELEARDISFYQNHYWNGSRYVRQSIDWSKFRSQAHAVFIRASEHNYTDIGFEDNISGCLFNTDMAIGVYHFLRLKDMDRFAKENAETFFETIFPWIDSIKLGFMMDFERNKYHAPLSKNDTQDYIWKFIYRFEELSGKPVSIYTNESTWNELVSGWNQNTDIPRDRVLWTANWREYAPPRIPYDWEKRYAKGETSSWYTRPDIVRWWQYSNRGDGKAHGCTTKQIDLNRYNGTLEEFNAEYGFDFTPIDGTVPPPVPELPEKIRIVNLDGMRLNLRKDVWGDVVGKAREDYVFDVISSAKDGDNRVWYKCMIENDGLQVYFPPFWVASWYAEKA